MSCSQETGPVRRIGTARAFVTEFEGCEQINPSPLNAEDSDLQLDFYLSPAKLRSLSGSDDLDQVANLEMCVDTRQNTLGNFGVYLPNLVQLKLNYSVILSVRDLGTTLSHLQVLSLVHCGLTDLEGITSLVSLKELYVAYNQVTELSPVSMLEHLELLDLERNSVDDLVQVQYLGLCGQLRTLSLEGNPVCTCPHPGTSEVSEYKYRSTVRKLIPQLRYLDDVPVEEEKEVGCFSTTLEDWALLKEFIKDNASFTESANSCLEHLEESNGSMCGLSRPCSAQRPGTSLGISGLPNRPATARPSSSSAGSRPGSAESDPDTLDHETSDLTHGVGRVRFCGNPLQAVRARREKIKIQSPNSFSRPCTQLGSYAPLESYVPEHTYDIEEPDSQDRRDVFAELQVWRKEHSKRLLAIEKDRQPQVMKIVYSDGDDDDDGEDSNNEDDKGGHNSSVMSNREEDEEKEGRHRDTDSIDSSFQSPLPDLTLISSSDQTPSPSPPPRAMAPSSGKSIATVRARRLRLSKAGVDMTNYAGDALLADPTAQRSQTLKALSPETLKTQTVPPQMLHKPHRPSSTPMTSLLSKPCSGSTEGDSLCISEHKPVICSMAAQRPTPPRPRTARAVLQRLPGHRTLLPDRGASHLN